MARIASAKYTWISNRPLPRFPFNIINRLTEDFGKDLWFEALMFSSMLAWTCCGTNSQGKGRDLERYDANASRRCSNYIFIPDLIPSLIILYKDKCKTRR